MTWVVSVQKDTPQRTCKITRLWCAKPTFFFLIYVVQVWHNLLVFVVCICSFFVLSVSIEYYQVVKVKIEYDQLMQDLSQSDIYACPADVSIDVCCI